MADVKQIKKMVPFIACKIPFCQYVCKLVFGVDTLDLNFGVQIDSVKQPIKNNSGGSGYMSHCGTSAFGDHFNHGFVSTNITQITSVVLGWKPWFCFGCG